VVASFTHSWLLTSLVKHSDDVQSFNLPPPALTHFGETSQVLMDPPTKVPVHFASEPTRAHRATAASKNNFIFLVWWTLRLWNSRWKLPFYSSAGSTQATNTSITPVSSHPRIFHWNSCDQTYSQFQRSVSLYSSALTKAVLKALGDKLIVICFGSNFQRISGMFSSMKSCWCP
jgi:hypothetical protein